MTRTWLPIYKNCTLWQQLRQNRLKRLCWQNLFCQRSYHKVHLLYIQAAQSHCNLDIARTQLLIYKNCNLWKQLQQNWFCRQNQLCQRSYHKVQLLMQAAQSQFHLDLTQTQLPIYIRTALYGSNSGRTGSAGRTCSAKEATIKCSSYIQAIGS